MNKRNYYVGLDLGTSSIGWAVTDDKYNLIRIKGKDYWGVREFDEAQTSEDRRHNRTSRRRRQREKVRIGMLQSFFHDAIEKEDSQFFMRLENSKYWKEDKDLLLESVNGVFNDEDYSDKEYFSQYPTIFHLRKALLEDSIEDDKRYARFVYLALLNMFKHRGHFLGGEIGKDGIVAIESTYAALVEKMEDTLENVIFPVDGAEKIESILGNRGISRSEKASQISEQLGLSRANKKEQLIVRGICGLKIDASKIFELDEIEKVEINFSDSNYSKKETEIIDAIGDDKYELIALMKKIYDTGILSSTLHGHSFLSLARVEAYNKHKADLSLLKKIYKEELPTEKYDAMFREIQPGNYSAYVNSTNSGIKGGDGLIRRSLVGKGRSREELYKTIRNDLKNLSSKDVEYVLKEIENETFLPKQITSDNGVIPNQLHRLEMEKILKNAEQKLSFLKENDETGLSVSEKILRLFSFQMPYYIGPTSEKSKTGWVIRKDEGQVLPWNIEEKIDVEATRVQFIDRLVRNCTYLSGEKVLPKNSLLYEKYCVLNEINNLRIDGKKISVQLKQDIYNDEFKKGKKLTKGKLAKYLANRGLLENETQLTGVDININSSLSSYGKFYAIFGDDIEKDSIKNVVERIIYYSTVFGESKSDLQLWLKKEYGNLLDEKKIKRILGYKFKDWGRVSREMLELPGCDKETGESKSLIQSMWDTNCNFMELINSEVFSYKESLQEKQIRLLKSLTEFKNEDLDEYYFSAPVKRMVWQTIVLLRTITKEMGVEPTRVFIEMTRRDGEKGKRTTSRGKQLLELYKNIKDESRDWSGQIKKADEDGSLKSKKLYLYYTQMGRCMYTGEPIDLEDLFDSNKYDIDHIYPRHYVKDDNINNNLVLVNKSKNARKSDNYPLEKMPEAVYSLWRMLHIKGLINDEKYRRLTGRNPFTDEQKAGFIARQLVETSQGTKGVADLIKHLFSENTTVVYAKASNVSDFRRDNDFLKSRLINDFHHAKDAYLNIVVGNVYFTKFTQNPLNFIKNELSKDENRYGYNLGKMYEKDVERNGYKAWIAAKNGEKNPTINTVKTVMSKNTPLITRWVYEAKGGIANETLYPAKKAKEDGYIPLKESDDKLRDITKYGGYNSVSTAYFFLVEHDDKKRRIRTIETVPIYLKSRIERTEEGLLNYCINNLGLKNPRICVKRIPLQSLVEINGYRCRISGRGDNRLLLKNEMSFILNNEWNNYIHNLEKMHNEQKDNQKVTCNQNISLFIEILEKHKHTIFNKRPVCIIDKLDNLYEKFINSDKNIQSDVLINLIQLTSIGAQFSSLKVIGEADKFGYLRINKNISNIDSIVLVNQSITGIYETKRDLLRV
ncbi:CRISPR-associated endonuclease Csn1 [Pseudobutyrivibrio sp. ACV-2]|uniref:type II CRISPR RNA-guided endonuclease Cas9 n=1 Tax=Pseudobutyrivibrio sp. ACV-2 TaxID=1520801 RepID=UPI0008979665|nr:type II CRISPR RNA-guided endonuclease Cas9 [Pseudobutyrivibrio sp. ACV-2]SDZ89978.1 CRISPR-associated endonuclease Csn1 [Pseudobutyrivibrio sp. ACV-2]